MGFSAFSFIQFLFEALQFTTPEDKLVEASTEGKSEVFFTAEKVKHFCTRQS